LPPSNLGLSRITIPSSVEIIAKALVNLVATFCSTCKPSCSNPNIVLNHPIKTSKVPHRLSRCDWNQQAKAKLNIDGEKTAGL
jgi:hypothetical protein